MSDLARQLASELRSLMATPVLTENDILIWIDKADLIRGKLTTNYKSLEPFITEELEHYFSDPDIRLKDSGYSERQNNIILSLISNLESGKIDELANQFKAMGYSGSIWSSGILRAPCIICIPFAILELIAFIFGYGSWIHLIIGPAIIILILASLGAACVYGNTIKYQIGFKDTLIIIFLCVLVSFLSYEAGWYARLVYRLPLLNSASQIVAALEQYKKDHGSYPVNSQYISSLSIPKNIHIYQGSFTKGEVTWSVFELGDSDITVLVEPKEFGVYVPVERTSPISFSSFAVYRYFSSEPKWVLGRVHWYITGASWTESENDFDSIIRLTKITSD